MPSSANPVNAHRQNVLDCRGICLFVVVVVFSSG